ncbi:MAG: hypothetical protein HC857_13675, partial [Synechococcales cyanobacterium RU_4_20]|nr:hypothetical protein [Synechococcales cyanobacterium RU_4_20]
MPRRRIASKSWARPVVGAIALLGTLLTGYLTILKLTGGEAFCPTTGCSTVLSSSYAEVLGLPLALFGCVAYSTTGLLAGRAVAMAQTGEFRREAIGLGRSGL